MKRQRSRNRNGGGNGKPQQNANRAFESNGPDGVKIRGAAQHVYEKYQQLARDALTSGDRVLGESYQQHAEHYFRVLRAMQPQRPASDIIGRDAFASGFDIDFEDDGDTEGGAGDHEEAQPERNEWRSENNNNQGGNNRHEGRRDERQRDERPRDDRPRDDRPRDRNFNRDDRPRDDRPRDDRPRDDRPRDDRPRNDRYRGDREDRAARDDRQPRDDRPPREERPQGERRFERVDPAVVAELPAPAVTVQPDTSAMLRSQDGEVSHAPAFLQPRAETRPVEPAPEAEEARAPRARRRRAPRTFEAADGDTAAPAGEDA
jgi:hypothetical protein